MQGAVILGSAAALTAAELLRRRTTENIEVTQTEVRLPEWPSALDGFRILLVSDLHVHPRATRPGRRERRVMEIISRIDCDILACPGDSANTAGAARVAAETLRAAKPRYGVFITLGNGEHKRRWAQTDRILPELQTAGRLLVNEHAVLTVNGARLCILGVDDPSHDRDRLDIAGRGVPGDAARILLAHSPEVVTRLFRVPVDMVVCGHTHGGQVCRPGGTAIWTQMSLPDRNALGSGLFGPDVMGRYTSRNVSRARLYVGRGVGTAKLAVRLFCRPEIAVLTLRCQEAQPHHGAPRI
jgi:predicted MPP superfamily phosphohydrolase